VTNGRHEPSRPRDGRDGRRASWARIPRATGNGSRWVRMAAAAVGLCAIVIGVSLAAFSAPSGQTGRVAGASNGGSTAATAQSTQPTIPVASGTTRPNVTNDGIAKTALRYPPALKDQMLRWAAGRGGVAWSAVTAQLGDVTQTAGTRLYSELRLECASLASSARAALDAPPIPDEAMQRMYVKVLAALPVTASDCRNAISVRQDGDEDQRIDVNTVLLNRSVVQFATESRELYTATAEIRTLRR
jgi:hypothetical protein